MNNELTNRNWQNLPRLNQREMRMLNIPITNKEIKSPHQIKPHQKGKLKTKRYKGKLNKIIK